VTPVHNVPLSGPGYLLARGREFPDLECVLQPEGVTIILESKSHINREMTSEAFEGILDAVDRLLWSILPREALSLGVAYRDLCAPTETITVTKHVTRRVKGHLRHITIKVKKTIPKPLTSPTTIDGLKQSRQTKHEEASHRLTNPNASKQDRRPNSKEIRRARADCQIMRARTFRAMPLGLIVRVMRSAGGSALRSA
jgi:hypothetical protein